MAGGLADVSVSDNFILNTDSYKSSHFLQYPAGAQRVSSYIEARVGGEDEPFSHALFFGLQAFLKEYLARPITMADLEEAEALLSQHGEPFNAKGWRTVIERHGGILPIEIEALAEGTVAPRGTALVQVVNTDPELPWLTSYMETALLRAVWYPTTVATVSWSARRIIKRFLDETCDDPDGQIGFKLHDFGARGVSSAESAAIGGLAHLVNFMGTDTVAALLAGRRWYGCPMAGFSIPAAEHSTITSWGRDNEAKAYANMLEQFGDGPLVAVVSDSYDLAHAVSHIWGRQLKDKVLAMNATLVVRPDSGDPASIVLDTIQRLMEAFGHTTNAKGYAVLNPKVRVIQGDGINLTSLGQILQVLKDARISAENVAFGMGGGLLQQLNRDTLRFAMKANAIEIDGTWHDVFKAPATDGAKASKAGRLAVVKGADGWKTVRRDQAAGGNLLEPVWRQGKLLRDWSLDEVRARAVLTTVCI
jgi:nicotinamide phosphoribosyltransferase